MNPEEIQSNKKIGEDILRERAKQFITRSSKSRFGFSPVGMRSTRIAPIIPKASIPDPLLKYKPKEESPLGEETSTGLGRLVLNLVQVNDNLNKTLEVIAEDIEGTKQKNKQEVDEYRKRIANRGKKITKKEVSSSKKGIVDTIKPFVSNFFSGAGGALRALAAWKLMMGILDGDPSTIIKSLLGIGLTFLPQIGSMIVGGLLKSLGAGLFGKGLGKGIGSLFSGGGRRVPTKTPAAARVGGLGKFAKLAALGTGALALGGALINKKPKEQSDQEQEQSQTQQRLEDLTAETKKADSAVISQNDLKRFQELNNRFEKAIQILIDRSPKANQPTEPSSRPGGGGGRGSGLPYSYDASLRGSVSGNRFNIGQAAALAKKVGATDEEAAVLGAIAMRESAGDPSIDTVKSGLDPQMRKEYSIGLWQINWKDHKDRLSQMGITSPDQLRDPVTNAQVALMFYRESGPTPWSAYRKVTSSEIDQAKRSLRTSPAQPPATPQPPTPTPQPPVQPPVQPVQRDPSAQSSLNTSPLSREIAFNIIPFPTKTPSASTVNNGSEVSDVDPNYYGDRYSILTQGELNLIG